MPYPSLSDVHVNGPLTDASIAWIQDQATYIADKCFPLVTSKKQSDVFFRYDKGDFLRDNVQEVAPGAEAPFAEYDIDHTLTFNCRIYKVGRKIPDAIRENADQPLDMDRDATEFVTQQGMLHREIKFAAAYMKTGVWGLDMTGVSAGPDATHFLQWDLSGSTPIEDISKQIVAMALTGAGKRPNKLALTPKAFWAIKNNVEITDRIKYGASPTAPAVVTCQALAQLWDLDEVMVGWATTNTAARGAAEVDSYILGNNALLFYAPPSPGILQASAGYTFAWTGLYGAESYGVRIKKYRWEAEEGDRVEGQAAYDMQIIAPQLGVFFTNCTAS